MSALTDLISQIENPELRARIQAEIERTNKQKKFGLVFEEHLPESTPLYDVPVKVGGFVSTKVKGKDGYSLMKVLSINDEVVECVNQANETSTYQLDDLVTVAPFGEPIFPYLKPIDSICNAPDSDLWHTLIEADNYHALQLLEYLYAGKVDCIYIDPPYNTGAKDWKYNNDYVDGSDSYRHSKWLSMMQKRLKVAKKLLNPAESVLIVTIDEKEYLHLGCLLEEMFPEARIQMISSVINPKGNRRDNEFSRCEEYIFFVNLGNVSISSNGCDMLRETTTTEEETEDKSIRLRALLRGASNHGRRKDRPNLFYPLLFKKDTGEFMGHGPVIPLDKDRHDYIPQDGFVAMWPIATNGEELTWNLQPETLMDKHQKHFLSFSKWDGEKRVGYYLSSGQEENFYNGLYNVVGTDSDGAYIIELKSAQEKDVRPLTIWHKKSHSASEYGTTFINKIIGSGRFSFPKSIYAVHDTIGFYLLNKPNALILDFFAGSGTTLHAVNLLNAEDNGKRRCILVTNNEVSEEEAKSLSKNGFKPGDREWDRLGIANYVTWPRTICSIKGVDIAGNPLKGDYISTTKEPLKMSDGFKANAAFFKLGFLDKRSVALGRQFKELVPVLWMKAGAIGPCPKIEEDILPEWYILPQNKMAILLDETAYPAFEELMHEQTDIRTLYLVTDSEKEFVAMSAALGIKDSYQIYRDYLDNFRINRNR